ncbi:MAG: alpha/beta hydrolase [Acidimicrobiia bacterium]|nr:alpha/beta hydrolase [Acidimicrobiia bacterium]
MAAASIVLVHGGGATARFWDRLIPRLDRPALAVDLPGRGTKPGDLATLTVDDEVASVVADVTASGLSPPFVLVAHSSGGLVVPGVVAALGGRVEHVVLNAASIPPEGGLGLDCMQPRHAEGVRIALERAENGGPPLLTPGPPDDPEKFRNAYGPPLDDETLTFVVDPIRCVVDTMHHYLQPVHWSRAGDVPVTYITTALDRPVPYELQLEMIERLPHAPTVVPFETGHIPAITDPEQFADAIRTATT